MPDAALALLAALTGVVTADAFVRSWTGLLRMAAALTLRLRGEISGRAFLARLGSAVPLTLLFALVLVLCFAVYLRAGLGGSAGEQVAFFLGAVPRTVVYLVGASRLIEAMFDPAE
jgi:hypothetical protein